ncbi:histidine phosphatase family protein [Hyphobacterium sp. CCMP332]|jgi:broad specificity phosphatase PhoE|uniref:histidine phosphatase family protein n=1 Tax=Hyphobacterium sp. CCMP332 TaxID=2749086 RepID=UPI00164F6E4D|nr:histidine phosphatase family protein [Hyphobacterium sp. CCMP332]QNL19194.1 histidine phosphatase family protein [Hyphobacterium sp. CCMP332]
MAETLSHEKPQPGSITIARHGQPDADRTVRIDWQGYEHWWKGYDAAGLAPGQTPPDLLVKAAAEASVVFCSSLPRAIETARAAAPNRRLVIDPDFVEAPLPPPQMIGTLKPGTWGVYARIWWWFGASRGLETRREAELRAERAADKLVIAAQNGPVVLCAHGWFNRMLRPPLRRRGWKCVQDGGDIYWSSRRYERCD